MARYVLTDSAKTDIRQIVQYLRSRSPQVAARVRAKLRPAMRLLTESPGIGHVRLDVTDEPIRFWRVYSYLIVYRSDNKPLEIIRVLHGARDLPAFSRA